VAGHHHDGLEGIPLGCERTGQRGEAAVDAAGLTVADLAAFIPHQANLLITKSLRDGFGRRSGR
jgi:3-oxoacyl-[acyl-carrier-protein] synthase III